MRTSFRKLRHHIVSTLRPRRKKLRVLLVSSGGGHWVELLRMLPAFCEHEMVFVTVNQDYRPQVSDHRFYAVPDATRWSRLSVIKAAALLLKIIVQERPDVVVTTGAAHGYLALRMAKELGARTIWVDSIANVETLSMSGQMAGKYADLWLTQWPHLARPDTGPKYAGAVL